MALPVSSRESHHLLRGISAHHPDLARRRPDPWQGERARAASATAACWPDGASALDEEPAEITAELAALPQVRDRYGLIHRGFELDNLIWRKGSIGILDMDDCSYLWYAADIVFALSDLFEENVDGGDGRLVPLFGRLGDLVKYARLVRAADLTVGPEHPEGLRELSRKLHDRASAYRASIEEDQA